MTHPTRALAAFAVLASGLWLISPGASAETPTMPKSSYKKAADADLAFLRTRLDVLAKAKTPSQGSIKPATGAAMLLATYGDALGDPALSAGSVKVAEAIIKADYKGAAGLAKMLTVKPGSAAGKGGLATLPTFEASKRPTEKNAKYLEHAMTLYRNETIGAAKTPAGYNLQQDIRDWTKLRGPTKIDPAAAEIAAVRIAVISEYALKYPNETATVRPDNKKKWDTWSQQSVDLSKQLAAEAAKGKGANEMTMKKLLTNINARCNDCHSDFRDN